MIVGAGIDVASVARVARLVDAHGAGLNRIFTPSERTFCEAGPAGRRAGRYAAAFAGKEAVMKALGTGWRGDVGWVEIDTQSRDARGGIALAGGAKQAAEARGISRVLLSLCGTRLTAAAAAVAERDEHD